MSFKKIIICFLLVLLTNSISTATINYKYVVTNIDIKGLKSVNKTIIKDEVNLESIIGQQIRPNQLERDIEKLYLLGIFESISANSEINDKEHALVLNIIENPKIKRIIVEGNQAISDKKIRKVLHSKKGTLLNFNTIKEDKDRLEAYYHKKGYSLFKVLEISSDKDIVHIKVSEGFVDEIKFEGLSKIRPSIVSRDLDMKKGNVFNTFKLRRDRERLLKTGFFSDVGTPKLITSKDKKNISIVFTVTERKFNKLNLGLEQEEEQFVGFISAQRTHALMQSDVLSTKLQISNENKTLDVKSYSIAYVQPWIFNKFNISFNSYLWTRFTQDISANQATSLSKTIESTKRVGGSVRFGKPIIKDRLTTYLGYKNERIRPLDSSSSITPYNIESLSGVISYSSVQNKHKPNTGTYWNLELERGGNLGFMIFEGLSFSREIANIASFVRFKTNHLLGARLVVGEFRPSDQNTFETESFIIGGSNSLRGYNEANYPFFGNKKIVFNTEYRYDLSKRFEIVLFYDIGMAQDEWEFELDEFSTGKGIGLRFQTPVGPIRTDFALGRNDYMIHFGLGQMF
jgi:outer membrane protein insertion porin family